MQKQCNNIQFMGGQGVQGINTSESKNRKSEAQSGICTVRSGLKEFVSSWDK